jgi:hypothetical protein
MALPPKRFQKKVCLLGAARVGKTSCIRRFVENRFSEDYKITLGTHMTAKQVRIKVDDVDCDVNMIVWDIIGQEGFESLRADYFQGAHGGIVVTDRTRIYSLTVADEWARSFRQAVGKVPLIFFMNKSDIQFKDFTLEQLQKLASSHGGIALETSAATGAGVEEAFLELARRMVSATAR